jgi:hypothetical protein
MRAMARTYASDRRRGQYAVDVVDRERHRRLRGEGPAGGAQRGLGTLE